MSACTHASASFSTAKSLFTWTTRSEKARAKTHQIWYVSEAFAPPPPTE